MQSYCGLYILLACSPVCAMAPAIQAAGAMAKAVLEAIPEEEPYSSSSTKSPPSSRSMEVSTITINEARASEVMLKYYFRSHQEIIPAIIPTVVQQLRDHADSPHVAMREQANNLMRVISEHNSDEACETDYARQLVLDALRIRLETQEAEIKKMQSDIAHIKKVHVSKKKAAVATAASSLASALVILALTLATKK